MMRQALYFLVAVVYSLTVVFIGLTGKPFRPDTQIQLNTRSFVEVRWKDSNVKRKVLELANSALPNETSMCFYGNAKDTSVILFDDITQKVESVHVKIAIIQRVQKANIDSSGLTFVYYKNLACNVHPDLIGIAHTHPLAFSVVGECRHSETDILFLNKYSFEYWFSVVLCPGGYMDVRWVDGRNYLYEM
jgi:hypothetical protein